MSNRTTQPCEQGRRWTSIISQGHLWSTEYIKLSSHLPRPHSGFTFLDDNPWRPFGQSSGYLMWYYIFLRHLFTHPPFVFFVMHRMKGIKSFPPLCGVGIHRPLWLVSHWKKKRAQRPALCFCGDRFIQNILYNSLKWWNLHPLPAQATSHERPSWNRHSERSL